MLKFNQLFVMFVTIGLLGAGHLSLRDHLPVRSHDPAGALLLSGYLWAA